MACPHCQPGVGLYKKAAQQRFDSAVTDIRVNLDSFRLEKEKSYKEALNKAEDDSRKEELAREFNTFKTAFSVLMNRFLEVTKNPGSLENEQEEEDLIKRLKEEFDPSSLPQLSF